MTLTQAIKLRKDNMHLIGQRPTDTAHKIADVIVTPIENFEHFMHEYNSREETNDEIISKFSSKEYSVTLIYEMDTENINSAYEDIFSYKKRNSSY